MSNSVRSALSKRDFCHREPDFFELVKGVRSMLLSIYDLEDFDVSIMPGSGTFAVEAMLNSFCAEGGKTLVISNGDYGERAYKILCSYKKECDILRLPVGKSICLSDVDGYIEQTRPSSVFIVHHETTTAVLNDIDAISHYCHERGIDLLLDAVSSFGAEDMNFLKYLKAMAISSNKCLEGPPGLAIVFWKKSQFKKYLDIPTSYCLNVFNYDQSEGVSPFTMPTHLMNSFRTALKELISSGGQKARKNIYAKKKAMIEEGIALPKAFYSGSESCFFSCFNVASPEQYEKISLAMLNNKFIVYPGHGSLYGKILRISVMGNISCEDIERFLQKVNYYVDV